MSKSFHPCAMLYLLYVFNKKTTFPDLSADQRAALPVASHEVRHRRGNDEEGSQRCLQPALRLLCHWWAFLLFCPIGECFIIYATGERFIIIYANSEGMTRKDHSDVSNQLYVWYAIGERFYCSPHWWAVYYLRHWRGDGITAMSPQSALRLPRHWWAIFYVIVERFIPLSKNWERQKSPNLEQCVEISEMVEKAL